MLKLSYGKLKLLLPETSPYIYYATFFSGQYDRLRIGEGDVVVASGAQ